MANNLSPENKVRVVSELCEGVSLRAIERMTGIHRDTIMRLGVRVGEACAKIMDERMRNLRCLQIEIDEIWGFIGKKQKHAKISDLAAGRGDAWTFIALDTDSKLIPSYVVGRRDAYHAKVFLDECAPHTLKSKTTHCGCTAGVSRG